MSLVGQGALTAVESRRRTMWDLRIGSALVLILAVLIALPFGLTRYQVGLATEI
jgi:hypothetical protein